MTTSATAPACIILAAGKGTRMHSDTPKVMHKIAGFPLITHVLRAAELAGCDKIIPVIAPAMNDVAAVTAPHACAIQAEQKGTGHAATCAHALLKDHTGPVLILLGDAPLIQPDTLSALIDRGRQSGLAVLGFHADDPSGYGRLVMDEDTHVSAIVEDRDCTPAQKDITVCNSGAFCVDGRSLFRWLSQIKDDNDQGEIYLTDLVAIAAKDNVSCALTLCEESEAFGINSRYQLAQAEEHMQYHLRHQAMNEGATLIAPHTIFLSADTSLGQDIVIEPNVFFGPGVVIEDNVTLHANSYLEGCIIRDGASVGPFARVRPQSDIGESANIGNFCEVNRSTLQAGAKCKHLSYLGDATIQERANIGAGTVIANYDGVNKLKTKIGAASFIGSNSTLIAPTTIGDGAYIAAGSTITGDVPNDALGVSRAKPRILEDWATKRRQRQKKD